MRLLYPHVDAMRALEYRSFRVVTVTLSATFIWLCLLLLPRGGLAQGAMVEGVGGLSSATGGELYGKLGFGGRLMVGWGGRFKWSRPGSALYGYAALGYDKTQQQATRDLASLSVTRDQLTLQLGARWYHPLTSELRGWVDLGVFGLTFDQSSIDILGARSVSLSSTSYHVELALGLQYKIQAGLLLSLGYYQLLFLEPDVMRLAERPVLNNERGQSWGRHRFALGLGWFF